MPAIIRNGAVSADNWSRIDAASGALALSLPGGRVLVTLAVWRAHRATLLAWSGGGQRQLGLQLEGHDDPAAIASDLAHFNLIAVNFPAIGDGRGYSLGRLLRERYGYRGELRATGAVLRDQLYFLAQCGFDAFALAGEPDEQAVRAALAGLNDFSEGYQTSVARPQPLFRRRLTGDVTGSVQ